MLAEECEKASPLTRLVEVAAPPGRSSKGSGAVKSRVGATTEATRAASASVLGTMFRCASASAASAVSAAKTASAAPLLFGLVHRNGVELAVILRADIAEKRKLRLQVINVTLFIHHQVFEQLG